MAILMRYEQVAGDRGGGLEQVAYEFNITPERVRFLVERERMTAVAGNRLIRAKMPRELRRRIYGGR